MARSKATPARKNNEETESLARAGSKAVAGRARQEPKPSSTGRSKAKPAGAGQEPKPSSTTRSRATTTRAKQAPEALPVARPKPTTTRANREPEPPPPTWDERLINFLRPWSVELAGLSLFLFCVLLLLVALNPAESGLLHTVTRPLRQLAGWGIYFFCLSGVAAGLHLMLRRANRPYHVLPVQVLGFELMLLAALPLTHQFLGLGLADVYQGRGGGIIGWALSAPLLDFLGPLLTALVHLGLFTWGLALLLRVGWVDVVRWLNWASARLQSWSAELEADVAERQSQPHGRTPLFGRMAAPEDVAAPLIRMEEEELIIIDDSAGGAPRLHKRDGRLPLLEALEEGGIVPLTPEEVDEKKRIIERTLLDFGLPATVTEIRRGPAVTQFGVQPGYVERPGPDGAPKLYKVRVSQIAALQKDLALVLAAPRLRIEAPVPGRGIVGVEAPNAEISVVRMRPVIESESFYRLNSPLAVALGRDVAGAPVATDLGKLPHLLIAGTTGSGKSVCLNAMVTCLAFNNTPEQLKLVMIDPKKVELIRFNGLPHLLGKVEVEGERVIGVLRWLTVEMDRRYEMFAAVGAKHLKDYNRKISRHKDVQKLPYMAVFIDELADLMATYPADVERTLCRLAQMARATGIHLVVATQRPSTDVITGLIKANFPARASFAVASGVDSRVILDTVGAEHLLGKGDMLFLQPDASAPVRIQGCFVSDREVEAVVSHWQQVAAVGSPGGEAPWENLIARQALIDETDDMLEAAIALVQQYDTISASFIQRRLRVGYPRAARLMEALFEMGLVEDPQEGGRTRRTYVGEDDDPLNDYLAQQGE